MRTQRQILRAEQTEATISAILAKARHRELWQQRGAEHPTTKEARDRALRNQANSAEANVKRLRTMLPKATGQRKIKIQEQIRQEELRFLIKQAARETK